MTDAETTDVDRHFEQLDEDTVLRLGFQGHCDQYLYRFPSGLMALAWGDQSMHRSIGIMDEDYCKERVEENHDVKGTVPFEASPFSEQWDGPSFEQQTDGDS